eukprot:1674532-Amphidinium_carterae.1
MMRFVVRLGCQRAATSVLPSRSSLHFKSVFSMSLMKTCSNMKLETPIPTLPATQGHVALPWNQKAYHDSNFASM